MPKYSLRTQILTPEEEKTISFSCKNPSRFFGVLPALMKDIFKITSSHFFEDKIKWDVGDDSVQFFAIWRGDEGKDGRTGVWAQIKFQGVQKLSGDKEGEATIFLTGILETEFPYTTIVEKTIYKIYTYLFYNQQRRQYLEEARQRFNTLEREIKREIGLEE